MLIRERDRGSSAASLRAGCPPLKPRARPQTLESVYEQKKKKNPRNFLQLPVETDELDNKQSNIKYFH